ncbi:YdiU family protein [Siminovitchia sp. FSL H7-0308]|uniref:protein adenylyltransferase SelO n=1 Tax=unclassified Siminovitchia TaxID=2837530 RepID=UPI0030D5DF64
MSRYNQTGWNFDNSYAQLPNLFYTSISPTPVHSPKLVILNEQLAESLGLNVGALQSGEGAAVFAGNSIPAGAEPLAQAYAGHQFGHFTMLGDGRAVLLGEQITPQGDRMDIQLKGSGKTPYSRGGDGRATLGPMLREYIVSEAMHALGIPTTRSLAVVTTGELIWRETKLPGAILTRVAASHLRVGTFEYVVRWGGVDKLQILADYTIKRHFPEIADDENKYLSLLQEVINRQAELIAKWQLVGFIHGVMNTDNMAISGETIDYGPCAFMDVYDPDTVFSSIDTQGRYAYQNQPIIGGWNLARFAETLLPLLHEEPEQAVKMAQEEVSGFSELFHSHWLAGMRAKLGIFNDEPQDENLITELLDLMKDHRADYTNTFRALTMNRLEGMDLFKTERFTQWQKRWRDRMERQQESTASSQELMRKSNPSVIPRNHRVEEALEAAVEKEDYSVLERLHNILSTPYAYTEEQAEYCTVPASTAPYVTYCGT